MSDKRPVYLNLFKIHLPVTGMVSLAHRATGILLFVAIPVSIYLLDLAIQSPQGFDQVHQYFQQPAVMMLLLMIVWSLAHHFFAGIRFLLIDVDIGISRKSSIMGAWLVIVLELSVVGLYIAGVWL